MNLKIFAYSILGIGGLCTFIFTILYLSKTGSINGGDIDIDVFDSFGSLIGGVVGILFSLAGVVLIVQTINDQDEDFSKQKIESRFFELLSIHRKNVKEMELKDKKGKSAIIWMMRELFECLKIAKNINAEFVEKKKFLFKDKEGVDDKLSEEQIIDFAYMAFFFGCVEYPKVDTFKEYVKEYNADYVERFINYCSENRSKIRKIKKFPFPMFAGHQLRLGHYFRHLYQAVNYIDKQKSKWLNYQEKYQYIKTLRAQLTTQEQVIFFFNSLSGPGKSWELSQVNDNNKLITKYNLIKNIPKRYAADISLKKYYPNVKFEGEKNSLSKERVIKKYS